MAPAAKRGPVEPHPLVKALNPDPAKPPQRTTKLFGYPGDSPEEGATRLWLDLDLTSYVDVPNEAFLYSQTLPDDAGTILWVAADAKLGFGSVSSHAVQAEFVTGALLTAHMATAQPSGFPGQPVAGIQPTPPATIAGCQSHFGPCPTPTAVTGVCCHSQFGPCQSQVGPCLTLSPTIAICCQTNIGPCHTRTFQCPTQPAICFHSQVTPCPTQPAICFHSQVTPCPTQPAICFHSQVGPCFSLPVCPTETCPPSHFGPCATSPAVCQSRLCPSVEISCQTTPACPTVGGCPPPQSLACGPGGVGGGPAA
jgi:hypothetical protein